MENLNYHTIKISNQYDSHLLFIMEKKNEKKNNVKKAKIILLLLG